MTTLLDRVTQAASLRQGRTSVANVLQTQDQPAPACPACQGRQSSIADQFVAQNRTGILLKLEHAFRSCPTMEGPREHAPWLAESSLRRALALHAHGALEGQDVILLGGDDLVSLAIGFLGQARGTPLARRVVVVEADPAWIDQIQTLSDQNALGIECVQHDLRDPLPEALRGRFDTFETDPPDTTAGLALFVSRAIQALKPGAGQQGLLCLGHERPGERIDIQAHLGRMGLAAHKVIPALNECQGSSVPEGSGQMVYVLTTAATQALVPQAPYEGVLYAGEVSPTVHFYVCTRCQARYRVGQRVSFVTIESLKAAGCARCGHTRFRHVQRVAVQPNRLPFEAGQAAVTCARNPLGLLPAVEGAVRGRGA